MLDTAIHSSCQLTLMKLRYQAFLVCALLLVTLVTWSAGLTCDNACDICQQNVINDVAGNLTSPDYPNNYPINISCTASIVVSDELVLSISFLDFDIEEQNLCLFDDLAIYDGDYKYTGRSYCGTNPPRSFEAKSSNVTLTFTSNTVETAKGFVLHWETRARCPNSEFTCWAGNCISSSQKCDEVKHCADDSDEIECVHFSSSFEECGKNNIAPEFLWNTPVAAANEASSGSWPWQAMLTSTTTGELLCGASLISSSWVVTAAQCVYGQELSSFRVYVGRHTLRGTSGTQHSLLDQIVVHPDYSNTELRNDIALLILSTPVTLSSTVRPVCLPTNDEIFNIELGTMCIAAGWGGLGEGFQGTFELYQTRQPTINQTTCNEVYGNIVDTQICAGAVNGGVGTCQTDAGGPLMCLVQGTTWYLFGVASPLLPCAAPGRPAVYTRISSFASWISTTSSIFVGWETMTTVAATTTVETIAPETTATTVITDTTTAVTPFTATTQSTTRGLDCGSSLLTSDSGSISSPGYPGLYPTGITCSWTIQTTSDKVLEVEFVYLDIEPDSVCRYDYLAVYDGDELYTGRRLCGTLKPRKFAALNTDVRLVFQSDHVLTKTGFLVSWSTKGRCSDDQFTCWNGTCIASSQRCNNVKDCADGSDEVECSRPPVGDECGRTIRAPQFSWSPRIVGGSQALPGSWPWQALVYRVNDSVLLCGASIVSRDSILTAASCLQGNTASSLRVDVGVESTASQAEQSANVYRADIHPSYTSATTGHDIAVLKLSSSLNYTTAVQPICVSRSDYNISTGMQTIATGFGSLVYGGAKPGVLYQVRLVVVDHDVCKQAYKLLTNSQMCAGYYAQGGADACQGDSGGPLVALAANNSWYQIGVTSHRVSCANPNVPGVYTKVSAYRSWFEDALALDDRANAPGTGIRTLPFIATWLLTALVTSISARLAA